MTVNRTQVQITLQFVVIVVAVALLVVALLGACTSSLHATISSAATSARSSFTSGPSSPTPNLSYVLPNRVQTPGDVNPKVTQSNVHSTICVPGWTATVRPPLSYTEPLKIRQLHSGYAWRGDTRLADYEEDHLIPLELGGAPTSVKNLWPEPHLGGAYVKDVLENVLKRDVCRVTNPLPLAVAQRAIADNWESAYLKYVAR